MKQMAIGFLLSDVLRLVRNKYNNNDSNANLPLSQVRTLYRIAHNEGAKQVEIAEQLEMKPMTLVRIIDQLVQDDLVERRPSPRDRRAFLLYLKRPKANKALADIHKRSDQMWAGALQGLSQEQIDNFITTMNLIHSNLAEKNNPIRNDVDE